MTAGRRPTKQVVDENGNKLATLAEIAREINDRFPPVPGRQPVSRQLLHKSWGNSWRNPAVAHSAGRRTNNFPGPAKMLGSANGGKGTPLWNVEVVVGWYIQERHWRISAQSSLAHAEGESTLAA